MTYSKKVIILTAIFSVVLANATEIEDGNNTTVIMTPEIATPIQATEDSNNTTVILMPEIATPVQATTVEDQNITVEQAIKVQTDIATPITATTPTKVIVKLPKKEKK